MTDGVLHLDPRLATGWNRLRFSLTHHGVPATVTLTPTTATVEADGGRSMLPYRVCAQPRAHGHPAELVLRTAAGTCRGERPVALA